MRLVFIAYHLLLYLLAEISFGEKDGGHARVTVVLLGPSDSVHSASLWLAGDARLGRRVITIARTLFGLYGLPFSLR